MINTRHVKGGVGETHEKGKHMEGISSNRVTSDRKETGYVPEGMTEAGQMDRRNRVGVRRRNVGVNRRYVGANRRYVGVNRRYVGVGRRCVGENRRYVGVGRRDIGAKRRCVGASRRCVGVGMDVTQTCASVHHPRLGTTNRSNFET